MRSRDDDEATHFGSAQPSEGIVDMRRGAHLGPQAMERGLGEPSAEIGRKLATGCLLDVGNHVGGPPAGKKRATIAGVIRIPTRANCCCGDLGRKRLAVDEHAIAVENDHARSPSLGQRKA